MEETCMKTRTFMVVVDCFVIGRVTTAYTITDDGELKAGFAYRSPMEKHFIRKIGRDKAIQRLTEDDCVKITVKYPHGNLPILPFVKALLLADARERDISWMRNIGVENLV